MEAATASMQGLSVRALPQRPGYGNLGQKVQALTNHFKLTAKSPATHIHVYTAIIRNETTPGARLIGRLKRHIFTLLLSQNNHERLFSDYEQMLVTWSSLLVEGAASRVFHVVETVPSSGTQGGSKQVRYSITISPLRSPLPTQPLFDFMNSQIPLVYRAGEYEQVLGIMMIHCANQNPEIQTAAYGSKCYALKNPHSRKDLGHGLWAYRGYALKVRRCTAGMLLNVNTTATACYREGRLDELMNVWKPHRPTNTSVGRLALLEGFIKKLRVECTYGTRRVRTIKAIARAGANLPTATNVTFVDDAGITWTVEKFFSQSKTSFLPCYE